MEILFSVSNLLSRSPINSWLASMMSALVELMVMFEMDMIWKGTADVKAINAKKVANLNRKALFYAVSSGIQGLLLLLMDSSSIERRHVSDLP
jgi:Flp pilus assembly protein protease CpaA